jgi:hypothetical protein
MICKNIPEFPKDMICKNIPEFPKDVTCKNIPNVCPDLDYLVCVAKAEAAAFTPITAPTAGCPATGITVDGATGLVTVGATASITSLLCVLSGESALGVVGSTVTLAGLLAALLGDLFAGLASVGTACPPASAPAAGSCAAQSTHTHT